MIVNTTDHFKTTRIYYTYVKVVMHDQILTRILFQTHEIARCYWCKFSNYKITLHKLQHTPSDLPLP